MQVSEQLLFVPASDGTRLACTLYLPEGDGPFATLLEALPYRKDDITSSYADSYVRFVREGGFAVLRVDLRGTGNSGGVAEDEYPDIERADLRTVIEWAAAQHWSNGKVGMFGTSYSGFNSLHMAMEGVPELGAVCATYATDDRYTDDVHYMGGTLRALDLIDYPLYMVAMNASPPTPAVWGDDWVDEWRRRIDQQRAVVARMVAPPAARRDVAPGVGAPRPRRQGLRALHVPRDAGRRMGRRLPKQHVPHFAARARHASAGGAVGAQGADQRRARPERRRRRAHHRLLPPTPARQRAGHPTTSPTCSSVDPRLPNPIC